LKTGREGMGDGGKRGGRREGSLQNESEGGKGIEMGGKRRRRNRVPLLLF